MNNEQHPSIARPLARHVLGEENIARLRAFPAFAMPETAPPAFERLLQKLENVPHPSGRQS
jgi:hypothetical protein